uniref:Leucine-rich repeat-containing protein 23 n=1 Tax=Aquila chrysaetos chrysaetos TaxID=223781 RepID=A0A663F245_AQUCH
MRAQKGPESGDKDNSGEGRALSEKARRTRPARLRLKQRPRLPSAGSNNAPPRPGAVAQRGCYGSGAGPRLLLLLLPPPLGFHGSGAPRPVQPKVAAAAGPEGAPSAGPVGMEGEEPEGDEYSLQEEEEEEEEEQVREAVLAPCPLTEEVVKEGLSLLCKTGNGLAHAYVKLEAKYKGLTDISLLECFIHLRYVDLSENKLQDLSPLSGLTHLLWLKVDGNLLTSACMQELPYLQIISFAHNRIKDMEGITHPRLANLSLKGNKIQTALGLSHGQLFSLQILELRGNMLESTAGLNLPKLRNLYLVRDQPARGVGQSCCRDSGILFWQC